MPSIPTRNNIYLEDENKDFNEWENNQENVRSEAKLFYFHKTKQNLYILAGNIPCSCVLFVYVVWSETMESEKIEQNVKM